MFLSLVCWATALETRGTIIAADSLVIFTGLFDTYRALINSELCFLKLLLGDNLGSFCQLKGGNQKDQKVSIDLFFSLKIFRQ